MAKIKGDAAACKIAGAMGLNPNEVQSIDIKLHAGGIAEATIWMLLEDETLEAVARRLKEYKIIFEEID